MNRKNDGKKDMGKIGDHMHSYGGGASRSCPWSSEADGACKGGVYAGSCSSSWDCIKERESIASVTSIGIGAPLGTAMLSFGPGPKMIMSTGGNNISIRRGYTGVRRTCGTTVGVKRGRFGTGTGVASAIGVRIGAGAEAEVGVTVGAEAGLVLVVRGVP